MPLPIIADVFRCAINLSDPSGGSATNILHFGAGGGATASDIAHAIDDEAATTHPWQYVANTFADCIIEVTPLDGATAPFVLTSANIAGTQSGTKLYEAAAVVKLTTALRGREHRGRSFIGPLTEGSVAAGALDPGTRSGLETAFQDWQAAVEANIGGNLKVASYKLSTAENVVSATVGPFQRTQRRRLQRVT